MRRDTQFDWLNETTYEPPHIPYRIQRRRARVRFAIIATAILLTGIAILAALSGYQGPQL